MFDNLKITIDAAETVLSDLQYAVDNAQSCLESYKERAMQYESENSGETDAYLNGQIRKFQIALDMYKAMTETVKSFVTKSLVK